MRVVVVGGGTAGWAAAYALTRIKPDFDVTVIESKTIGIIGAGEGSTAVLSDFVTGEWFPTDYSVSEFVKATRATTKYGIYHKNWRGDGTGYMAPIDGTPTERAEPDRTLLAQLHYDPLHFHESSECGFAYQHNLRRVHGTFHFDAFKMGEFYKGLLEKNEKVTFIEGIVDHVHLDEQGYIERLTGNGIDVEGDFFFDCTGFRRVLMNALGGKWKSYKKNLPVNRAIGFQAPIDPNYKQVTIAHALKNGWVWTIPTQDRYGCGYVFSDNHISKDDAYAELCSHYGPVDILREFSFDTGRQEEVWMKNCLSLGLSSAFAEPLEATSIHTTITQFVQFMFCYLRPTKELTCDEYSRRMFNERMGKMYDDIKDFLVLHYTGGRTDSEFWRQITNGDTRTEFVDYVIELSRSNRLVSPHHFPYHYVGMAGSTLYKWILIGLKHYIYNPEGELYFDIEAEKARMDNIKSSWHGSVSRYA